MAKEIRSDILIHATPDKVWKILTSFDQYPQWNPFIRSITGNVSKGQKINVRIEPPGGSAMSFKPKVLAFETNREIRWLGHLGFPGLFDGEHKFELIDHGNGKTTFKHSETFRGILVPLFKKMLDINTKNGFIAMNQKLKEKVEQN